MPDRHGLVGLADAGAFLARLTRLDPAALVRLRSAGPAGSAERTQLWAWLPWAVLVGRVVDGPGPGDVTVSAAELLAELEQGGAVLPRRRDADWRRPVPPSPGVVVERIAGADLRRIAEAAAGTLRTAAEGVAGRAVGQRALRDALLDHVAVVVTTPPSADSAGSGLDGGRIEIPQRLVQGIVRMGFLGPAGTSEMDAVQVRIVARWVGLAAPFGVAWLHHAGPLAIRSTRGHPNG
ncbi:hypothetical protein [Micromonospora sp. HM5-17]|uniref:hypothetical protein n=1 Tax=Micromonospora sp. HM5-17 TaxID=2487710 RepID=UPI000F4AE10E|nr:hypothetical protein [Micromonospora sp. HM5-17]ROT26301.1 hypothetical protein EF879_25410 [Micromonospora sp. HM5-17]